MFRLAAVLALFSVALVVAVSNAASVSVNGGTLQQFVLPPPPLPDAPEGVTASAQPSVSAAGRFAFALPGAIEVAWLENHPGDGVSEYRVYRAGGSGQGFERVGATDGTSFTDTAVDPGERYVYYVTAVNAFGESPPSDEATAGLPLDCDALRGAPGYADAAAAGDCPGPTPAPTATAVASPETREAEATPGADSTPEPSPTPAPGPTSTPFPAGGSRAAPSRTPLPTQTPLPTATPQPSPGAEATLEPPPEPEITPAPVE